MTTQVVTEIKNQQLSSFATSSLVLGVPLAEADYASVITKIDSAIDKSEQGYFCVAAVHTVMECRKDPELRSAVLNSTGVLPDGQPLVWAMKSLGSSIKDRIYGPELMLRYCKHAALNDQSIFLYGGRNEEGLNLLINRLTNLFPGLRIAGSYCPPFKELSEAELEDVATRINNSEADTVWVGIGVPKQEKWMAKMRSKLSSPILIGVGAAFDFHAELIPQAPKALQRIGMEWLFRLFQEPKRLWRRYLIYNPLFIKGFLAQYWYHRRSRKRA